MNRNHFLSVLFVVVLGGEGLSQPRELATYTPGKVVAAFVDRLGDFYVRLNDEALVKYSADGKEVGRYKLGSASTYVEPWDGFKPFVYDASNRTYTFLDRSLAVHSKDTLDPAWAIDPVLVCPGDQKTLWILDKADWSLKHIDLQRSRVLADNKLGYDGTPDVVSMCEYQNYLFLHDKRKGVLIFNILGFPADTLAMQMPYFHFLGQELYYPEGDDLAFYDLFDGEEHKVNITPPADIVLMTDDRMLKVAGNKVTIYRIGLK